MMTKIPAGVLLVIAVAACAGGPARAPSLEDRLADRNYYVTEPVDEILQYRIDGWNYVDRRHLILHTGPGRSYLISLAAPCHNLGSVEDIAFSTTVGRLSRSDTLLVDSGTGIPERCFIDGIYTLARIDE